MNKIKELVGSDGYNILLKENITTLQNIINVEPKSLNMINLSIELIHKIKLIAAKEILKNKIQTADQITAWDRISTGCHGIDNILRGGIPINGIIEIFGASGVGKTQLCLQLALQIQLPHGLEDKHREVVYISTEDVFPCKRLNQLAKALNMKHNCNVNFEDHIYLEHVADSFQLQKCLLNRLPYFLSSRNVRLIIIDSIAGLFRSENENCNYTSRSLEFKRISKALNSLQDQYNVAIVITNQVTDNVEAGLSEPCLGLSWANNVTCRFCLSKNADSPVRKFEVIFAPDLAVNSTNIIITPEGILDTE